MTEAAAISCLVEAGRKIHDGLQSSSPEVRNLARIADEMVKVASCLSGLIPKWISVEERLPEPGKNVLIRIRENTGFAYYATAKYDEEYGDPWVTNDENYYLPRHEPEVTHWTPIPEPPEVNT